MAFSQGKSRFQIGESVIGITIVTEQPSIQLIAGKKLDGRETSG